MARLAGPTFKDIATRHTDAERAVKTAVRQSLRRTVDGFTGIVTVDDLGPLTDNWTKQVDASLLRHVKAAYWHGVDTAQRAVVSAVQDRRSQTAGVDDGSIFDDGSALPEDLLGLDFVIPRVAQTAAEQLLAEARNRLVNVGNDVWETVRAELLIGLKAGESIRELQARIMDASDFAATRAEVVARSEVGAASNTGAREEMQALGVADMTKEWLAIDDGRTRPEHAAVDGERVGINDTFSIGFEPGDDYNCRCTTGFDIPNDALDALGASSNDELDQLAAGAHATVGASRGAAMTQTLETATTDAGPDVVVLEFGDDPVQVVVCPVAECAHANHVDAKFCSQCGADLAGVVATAIDADGEDLGGKPNKGTAPDKRLKTNKPKPAKPASEADDTALAAEPPAVDDSLTNEPPMWRGPLVIEGSPTGDGREFANDALQWVDPPLPFRWQKEDSHGGMATNVTVNVGLITKVWRDGNNIMGEGVFDLGGPETDDAHEAYRRMGAGTLSGVSIDADDITDADIEYVFPDSDDETEEDDLFFLLFAAPEKIIFHSARIRAATLCDIPAFVEAQISLIPEDERQAALTASALLAENTFGAVSTHTTATSDGTWDGPSNETKLPSPMSVATAKAAYAWIDDGDVENGEVPKSGCKFIHHEVNADGTPGAANLTACSTGIGVLNGGRGGTTIPDDDQRGVYNHLARHLRDADREPPPFEGAVHNELIAAAWREEPWRPPHDWFQNPELGQVMPIMVTEQGRVYGHAAQWGQCHLGYMNECVMPPFEEHHDHYLTGEVICDNGARVAVGQITAGIEHARLTMTASQAKDHYENTDAVVCDVVIGNDKHGIWVAGGMRPWAHASRAHALRASGQVSPDWRRIGGALRLVALLTVNTSGYQVPRARSFVAGGDIQSLVSSGMIVVQHHAPSEDDLNQRALNLMRQQLVKRVHGTTTEV